MKRIILTFLVSLFLAGCSRGPGSVQTAATPAESHVEEFVAIVNGEIISRSEVVDILLRGRGRKLVDELVQLTIVRQRANERGVILSDKDLDQELVFILEDMSPGKTRREQESLLEYMLKSRGLTRAEFDIVIERKALLRLMVEDAIVVAPALVRQEYQRVYGAKVLIRQLVTSSLRQGQTAQRRLERGDAFIDIVNEMSEDQASLRNNGLLGPFSRQDENIPEPIRNAAFALTAGSVSELISYYDSDGGQHWCLIRLEQSIVAENPLFDTVGDSLTRQVRSRLIAEQSLLLLKQLQQAAEVELSGVDFN